LSLRFSDYAQITSNVKWSGLVTLRTLTPAHTGVHPALFRAMDVILSLCCFLAVAPRRYSLERRWSSRRFPYGYLVTTSSQLPTTP